MKAIFPLFFIAIILFFQSCETMTLIKPSDTLIAYNGRYELHDLSCELAFPATGIKIKTDADSLYFLIEDTKENLFQVIVDGIPTDIITLRKDSIRYPIQLPEGTHTLELFKRTESEFGSILFKGIEMQKGKSLFPVEKKEKAFMFIGNSITCGYGNEGENEQAPYIAKTENSYLSYASMTARAFDAEYHLVAYSGRGIVRNWAQQPPFTENMQDIFERALADDTSSTWDHSIFVPQCIIINLGTNDTSPGYDMSGTEFMEGYNNLLNRLDELYPKALVVMLTSQMVHNEDRDSINNWLNTILDERGNEQLHHFELSAQDGSLGFGADYHPSVKQNEKNAQELIAFLKKIL